MLIIPLGVLPIVDLDQKNRGTTLPAESWAVGDRLSPLKR